MLELIVSGLRAIADIVAGVRDARAKNVKDALQATAAGRAASDAAQHAGRKWCQHGVLRVDGNRCMFCGGRPQ